MATVGLFTHTRLYQELLRDCRSCDADAGQNRWHKHGANGVIMEQNKELGNSIFISGLKT